MLYAKKLLPALLLLLLAQPTVVAQERTTANSQPFEMFWSAFKRAIIKGDKVTVASMTKFPLAGDLNAPSRTIFLRQYGRIFTKGFKRLVMVGKPYKNAEGGFSVVSARSVATGRSLYLSFEKFGATYRLAEIGAFRQ